MFTAKKLCWRVGDKNILNDISFDIVPGEFLGLIGPNGAGKSSLLRCLYRKIAPSSGHLLFNQQPIEDFSRRQLATKVAVVLQEAPSQFDLSVGDVIAMGLTPHKSLFAFDDHKDLEQVQCAARKVDLFEKLDQSFNSLSGGEKQRAMIARAIVQRPEVLIMDEPTNHLDIRHQIEVLQLARQMRITVVVSIHDLNLAAAYCDRLLLLDKGRVVALDTVDKVLTEENLAQVFGVSARITQHPLHPGKQITFNLRGDL